MHRYPIIINYINTANNMNMNNEKLRYFFLFRFVCLFIGLFTLPFIIMHMKTDQKLWKSYWMSTEHTYSCHLFFFICMVSFGSIWTIYFKQNISIDAFHSLINFCWNDFVLLWFCFDFAFFPLDSGWIHINIQNH